MTNYASANGIEIHYAEAGTGDPLLLLNNGMVSTNPVWAGHPSAYGAHLDTFAEHFHVFAPDIRGSGRTKHSGGPITYGLLADDIAALIDALGLDRPLICGFSEGGLIATIAGIRRPDSVKAIVNHGGYDLMNPESPSIPMTRQMLGGGPDATEANFEAIAGMSAQVPELGSMFELMKSDHDAAQGPGHWKTVVKETFPRITRFAGYTFDDLAKATAPTLILTGDRDQLCSVEEGVRAYRALSKGELAVLPSTGHAITAAGVQAAIEFLERC
jgi:pimeloyl-ACP methyl ester carboxylesterase